MSSIERVPHWQDTAHQGEDYVRTLTLSDDNGNAEDLTGYTCQVQWRTSPNKPPAISLSVGSGITITAASGIVEIEVTQAQLSAIAAGNYTYDVILKSSGGTYKALVVVEVYLEARITVWAA